MARIHATLGAKVYIGGPLAAKTTDFVLADFNGQSWLRISWLENAGGMGDEAALITFDAIDDGRTHKLKGVRNAGQQQLVFGVDYDDDGQAALIAAEKETDSYAFRFEFNDAPPGGTNSFRYYIAKVMTAREMLDTANNVMKLNGTLEIDSNIVRVDAAP
jgi:hypothetical protein